jgi:hypothetical protein
MIGGRKKFIPEKITHHSTTYPTIRAYWDLTPAFVSTFFIYVSLKLKRGAANNEAPSIAPAFRKSLLLFFHSF